MQQYLEAGRIVTTHGVVGEVKVELWCDSAAFLAACKRVYFSAQGGQAHRLLMVRAHKGMALVKLEGVTDMDQARALIGQVLYIDRADAHLPKGACFVQDLIGCQVRDADNGWIYGTLTEVSHPGAQDIYTITDEKGNKWQLPAVPEFVKERVPEEGYVLVAPIPGMFGEAESGDAE